MTSLKNVAGDQRSSDTKRSSGARSGASNPSAGASKFEAGGINLDFASVLADVNSLMNNEPMSNEDFDNDDDSEYDVSNTTQNMRQRMQSL